MEMDEPFDVKELTGSTSKSREASLKGLPKIDTRSDVSKRPSSKNLDHDLLENPSPQILLSGVSPMLGDKSPSTGTGLVGNRIVPITLSQSNGLKPNSTQSIYNLQPKFPEILEADNVVEVFDLTKGKVICDKSFLI